VKDVKYIWYGMTYRELRDILKEGIKIREASVSQFKMGVPQRDSGKRFL
jgi:hypothetical protein